jgi:hypothetical protein
VVQPGPPQTSTACGTVSVRGPNPPTDPAASQVERCFLTAYQSCDPATLTLQDHGVDLTTTMTFSIESGSPCRIAGTSESAQVAGFRTTSTFTCAGMIEKDGGLLLVGCGKAGDIAIPPPAPVK